MSMNTDKLCQLTLGAMSIAALLATPATATAGNMLLDPGIRHTNGMPIASSEPRRTTSVNWTCNPDKIGYCGGYYCRPCVDSLRVNRLVGAARGCYLPAGHSYQSHAGCECPSGVMLGGMDGIEPAGMTPLGELPNNLIGPGGLGPGGVGPSRVGPAAGPSAILGR